MLATLAGAVAEAAPGADILSILLTWGPGGLLVVLLMTGLLVTKSAHERALADRDKLIDNTAAERDRAIQAYTLEQAAHKLTQEARTAADHRADMVLDLGRTTNVLLDALGHSARGDYPRDART